jgi:hypothetical protein
MNLFKSRGWHIVNTIRTSRGKTGASSSHLKVFAVSNNNRCLLVPPAMEMSVSRHHQKNSQLRETYNGPIF